MDDKSDLPVDMFGFLKTKKNTFPSDHEGRRDFILGIHRYVSCNPYIRDNDTIDLLLDLISDESDPFILSSYIIYYIGGYKPFAEGNAEVAKRVADVILADGGWVIPNAPGYIETFKEACDKQYPIEDIANWERSHAERLHR